MIDKIVNKLKVNKGKPSKVLNTLERVKKKKFKGFDSNKSLKDIDGYKFINNREYKDIINFVGDIKLKNLVGEGFNGIVINHPVKKNSIVKIAKPHTFDLVEESETHDLFRKKVGLLRKEKKEFKNIYVPNIISKKGDTLHYQMEKIKGQNFTTLFYLEIYQDIFKKYKDSDLKELSDNEVKLIIMEKGLPVIECSDAVNDQIENKLIEKKYEGWWKKKKAELGLDFIFKDLENEGFIHGDGHGGNMMLDESGKIYLIDFGTSEVLNPNL